MRAAYKNNRGMESVWEKHTVKRELRAQHVLETNRDVRQGPWEKGGKGLHLAQGQSSKAPQRKWQLNRVSRGKK